MFNNIYYGFLVLFQNKQAKLYFSQKKEAKQLYNFMCSGEQSIIKSFLSTLIEQNKNREEPFLIQPFHEKINNNHPIYLALIHLNKENFILFCQLLANNYDVFTQTFIHDLLKKLASIEENPIENLLFKDEPHKLKKAIKSDNLRYLVDNYLLFHLDRFDLDYTFQIQNKMKEKLPKDGFINKFISMFTQTLEDENRQHMIHNYPIIIGLLEKLVKFSQQPVELKESVLKEEKNKKMEENQRQELYHLIMSHKREFSTQEFFKLIDIIKLIEQEKDSLQKGNVLSVEQIFYLKKVVSNYLPELIKTYLNISDELKYTQKTNNDHCPSETFQLSLEEIILQIKGFHELKEERKIFDLEQKQKFLKNKNLYSKA